MKKTALCIGINQFPKDWDADLSECINDAQGFAVKLKDRGWEVATLLDRAATRKEVLYLAKLVIESAGKNGIWGITKSSHGTRVPDLNRDEDDGMDEATCCADGNIVLDDEWWKIFRGKPEGSRGFFASDCCHSGTVARAIQKPAQLFENGNVIGRRRFVSYKKINPEAWNIQGDTRDMDAPRLFEEGGWPEHAKGAERVPWPVLLLAGCQDDEYSYDAPALGHGAFTHAALTTLDMLPEGATFNDWFVAIRKMLPNSRYPQTPRMIGSYINQPVLFG